MTTESTDAAGAGGHDDQVEVRAGTVLRARREDIELHTADGLTLVGELALPPDRDPVATLVTLHPLPTHGGFMDRHVLRKASYRLPALADIAVLRFNTRGTTSARAAPARAPSTTGGAERFDVAAAIEFAEFRDCRTGGCSGGPSAPTWRSCTGCDPAVEGAILLSPPLRFSGAERPRRPGLTAASRWWRWCPSTTTTCAPRRRASGSPRCRRREVVGVDGGRHLWVGETLVRRALDEIVAVVAPDRGPLPRTVPASLVAPEGPTQRTRWTPRTPTPTPRRPRP